MIILHFFYLNWNKKLNKFMFIFLANEINKKNISVY